VPVLSPTALNTLTFQLAISSGPPVSFLATAGPAALEVRDEILLHQKTQQLEI